MLGKVSMDMTEFVTKRGLALHYSAGFLINFLLILTWLLVDWQGATNLSVELASFGLANFYLFIINACPIRRQEMKTDGDILLLLNRADGSERRDGGTYSPDFYECLLLDAQMAGGMCPEDLPSIRVDSEDDLVKVQQAILGFIQAYTDKDETLLAEYISYIRPQEVSVMNIDEAERLAYAAIYDSGVVRNSRRLREDFEYGDGILAKSGIRMCQVADFCRQVFLFQEKIVPHYDLAELETYYLSIYELLDEETNLGMRAWTKNLINERWSQTHHFIAASN